MFLHTEDCVNEFFVLLDENTRGATVMIF
jgi:hypothetical protein